jgi:hypothetical protein
MVIKGFLLSPTIILCALCVLARDVFALALCALRYAKGGRPGILSEGGTNRDAIQAYLETLKQGGSRTTST